MRQGAIVVDEEQNSSVAGVLAAGECTGVGGEARSIAEGWIAGSIAAGAPVAGRVVRQRAREHRFAARLAHAFSPGAEVRSLGEPGTVVCRCEDVALGRIDADWDVRAAKLYSRVGMGPCQGRVCGAALACSRGMATGSVRAPIYPAMVTSYSATLKDHEKAAKEARSP
jgi:hypothetical protein